MMAGKSSAKWWKRMTNARANRGAGNRHNENWDKSPFWDYVEKKKQQDNENKQTKEGEE